MFAAAKDAPTSGSLAIQWTAPRALREPAPAIKLGLLEAAARSAPGDRRVALAFGEALIGLLEFERAALVLSQAVALAPEWVRPRLRLAQTLAMLRRFDETHALLGTGDLGGVAADVAEGRYLRGLALEGLGEPTAAEAAYRSALEAYPAHSPAFRKLAVLLEAAGRRRELSALCRRLLEAGVRHSRLLAQCGAELARAGDVVGAKALLLEPQQVACAQIPTPAGFASLHAFNAALADEILANPYASQGFAEDPVYRGGPRVHHLLHGRRPALILTLLSTLQDQVSAYCAGPASRGGLWREAAPARASLAFWGVVQSGPHHLDWHLHPNAWLSGVYYVHVPSAVTAAGDGPGCIEFGPPPEVGAELAGEVPILRIAPQSGTLLLAPAHYHHRSIPTGAQEKRISVAFDVTPQGAATWPPPAV